MRAGSTVFVIILLFQRHPLGIANCLCAPHTVMTTSPQNIWPCTMGHRDFIVFFILSVFIVLRFLPQCLLLCDQELCFLEVVPIFRHFSPLCLFECLNVYSWWDCGSRSTVRSNCRVVFGSETGLIREEVKENIMSPLSFFTVSPIFCLSSSFLPPFHSSLWLSTRLHRMMAVLHGSLTGRERDGQTQKDRKRERGCREGSPQTSQAQVTTALARRLLTTSKPLDASWGATRAAKWVGNIEESVIVASGRKY